MTNFHKRKQLRLKNYDYTQPGYYFVTICTHNKACLLSNIVGGGFHAAPQTELTPIGKEIVKTIEYIGKHYPDVTIDKYIVMPNHIHLIIILNQQKLFGNAGGRGNPPLHKLVGQLKSYTNKRYNDLNKTRNLILWQRNYYEHVIRDEEDYQNIYEYIETNPAKWKDDKYYL